MRDVGSRCSSCRASSTRRCRRQTRTGSRTLARARKNAAPCEVVEGARRQSSARRRPRPARPTNMRTLRSDASARRRRNRRGLAEEDVRRRSSGGSGDVDSPELPDRPHRSPFALEPGGIKTVGRAARADFILDAPLVSRLHCRLEAGDDTGSLDLESTNGTFVNDKRVTARAVDERRPTARGTGRVDNRASGLTGTTRETDSSAAPGRWSCSGHGPDGRAPRRQTRTARCESMHERGVVAAGRSVRPIEPANSVSPTNRSFSNSRGASSFTAWGPATTPGLRLPRSPLADRRHPDNALAYGAGAPRAPRI